MFNGPKIIKQVKYGPNGNEAMRPILNKRNNMLKNRILHVGFSVLCFTNTNKKPCFINVM